jgi:hypothetical protein
MPKATKKKEPTSTFTMEINGHKLAGRKVGNQWEWMSSVKGLAKKYSGTGDLSGIVAEFTTAALSDLVRGVFIDPLPAEQVKEVPGE